MTYSNDDKPRIKKIFGLVAGGLIAVTGLSAGISATVFTGQTDRGIDYRMGKMTTQNASELRQPGLSFKVPFITSVTKVDISQQESIIKDVETYTKDNQVITATLAVLYKLSEGELVGIYKNNPDYEAKLENTVLNAAKSALGKYEAQNIAQNREAIMQEVTKETKERVKTLLGIDIVAVQLPDFKFDDKFKAAVSSAANAKAELNRKETELQQQEVEKKKAIVNAQARAAEQQTQADANAYTTQKNAEAQIAAADAQAKAATKQAEAKMTLAGAEAGRLSKIMGAVGQDNMKTWLITQTWKGDVPQVAAGGGGSAPIVVPVPTLGK